MKIIDGDVLTPNKNPEKSIVVCHQVNCMGVMGAGLAKQIKDQFPGVFQAYKEKCSLIKSNIGGLGDVQFCSVLDEAGYIIANVFGQYYFGRFKRHTDYNALKKAFATIATSHPTSTIRIPYKFGCGLAGGDWNVVSRIIEEELVNKGVDVEIWKFE